jgi:hypothetical protein
VREASTRHATIYDGLGLNAQVSAVYLSPAVREAKVARQAAWFGMTEAEREAQLVRERDEAIRYDDFLVALFTPDRHANDLDVKASSWSLGLELGEGEALRPEYVTSVRVDPTLRALFPSVGDFDAVYRVRFERVTPPLAGRPFALRLAGAQGGADLDFSKPPR